MKKVKDKVIKLKRKHVDWFDVLSDLGNHDIWNEYYLLLSRFTIRSRNRLAYLAIRKHSTTATMLELRLRYGVL